MVINERDEVAVIIAKDYNSQWYTNHGLQELITDENVVQLVEKLIKTEDIEEKLSISYEIEKYCDKEYGERDYYGDAMCLGVVWVPNGCAFNIVFEDYQESIIIDSAIKE